MKKRRRSAQITLLLAGATALVGVGCQQKPPVTTSGTWDDGSGTNVSSAYTGSNGGSGAPGTQHRPSFWSSFWGPSWYGGGYHSSYFGGGRSGSTVGSSTGSSGTSTGSSHVGSVSRGGFGSSSSHFSSSGS